MRGDLHSHSDWSDGGSPIPLMAEAAKLLGREYLALTDHSPNLTIANGLSVERLTEQLDVVAELNASNPNGFRLLAGIEVDILESGELDQSPEMLDRLDIVVASVHSKLRVGPDHYDAANAGWHPGSAHQRAGPLHRPPRGRIAGHPAPVRVRCQGSVCCLR